MPTLLVGFITFAVVIRFAALFVSIRNEKRMKANGAVEYCAGTSTLLALTHIVFYLVAIAEGIWRDAPVSTVTYFGIALYAFAMLALVWVISVLGRFWTVKVIVAPDHQLVKNRLFNAIRHPNYFVNIIPELIGFALALQAWGTLIVGLPVYLVILFLRIRQEEGAMREHFPAY
ncbi:isoprenylcysteine carboxyl methyltransferase family protein [Roseibium sp.]|uniref:isoprenylcysteine carboxyl methyltransferase family protein n=1 Tax=Roseibium sp. TaxID=1936156 RepID=UPI003A98810C